MKKFSISLMIILAIGMTGSAIAGTAFIPIWQHGYGVTYFNNLINTDTSSTTMSIRLYDVVNNATYTTSSTVAPMEAWITDTGAHDGWYQAAGGAAMGFGWGQNVSNGAPKTMFAWGAIYGTVSGKITGLTVLAPESGF